MIVKMPQPSPVNLGPIGLRCPACRHKGTFEQLPNVSDAAQGQLRAGLRRCPAPDCRAVVYVVSEGGQVRETYPAERIDFDPVGIPDSVVKALEEAITCHANQCFTAAAIMVRKTLEMLCDAQGATGPDLKHRLQALHGKVVIPQELLEGLHDLRLLGNDAAHVESKEYEKVGREEVEAGIALAKEVLKATYQYAALLSQLRALKKP